MAVICSQIHYIELFSLNMIKYYQIFLCVFSEEEDNFPSALLSHISLLKALAFFVIKKTLLLPEWSPSVLQSNTISAQMMQQA